MPWELSTPALAVRDCGIAFWVRQSRLTTYFYPAPPPRQEMTINGVGNKLTWVQNNSRPDHRPAPFCPKCLQAKNGRFEPEATK